MRGLVAQKRTGHFGRTWWGKQVEQALEEPYRRQDYHNYRNSAIRHPHVTRAKHWRAMVLSSLWNIMEPLWRGRYKEANFRLFPQLLPVPQLVLRPLLQCVLLSHSIPALRKRLLREHCPHFWKIFYRWVARICIAHVLAQLLTNGVPTHLHWDTSLWSEWTGIVNGTCSFVESRWGIFLSQQIQWKQKLTPLVLPSLFRVGSRRSVSLGQRMQMQTSRRRIHP